MGGLDSKESMEYQKVAWRRREDGWFWSSQRKRDDQNDSFKLERRKRSASQVHAQGRRRWNIATDFFLIIFENKS